VRNLLAPGVFILFFFSTLGLQKLVAWLATLESALAASWIQALGTLLALVIALGLSAGQRYIDVRDRRSQDLAKARTVAFLIWDSYLLWAGKVHRMRRHIFSTARDANSDPAFLNEIAPEIFVVPKPITEQVERLYLLGAAGDKLLKASWIVGEARLRLNTLLEKNPYGELEYKSDTSKEIEELRDLVKDLDTNLDGAAAEIMYVLASPWADSRRERLAQALSPSNKG
jgi:hypothetical protein